MNKDKRQAPVSMAKVGKFNPPFISLEKNSKFSIKKEIKSIATQKKILVNVNFNLPIMLLIINRAKTLNKKELVLHLFHEK